MRRVWMFSGVITLIAACAGGVRPAYAPLPQAVADTMSAPPTAVVGALLTAIAAEGLQVQWQSAPEGYVETQWYDLVGRRSGAFDRSRPEQFIRLKFFVDPMGTTGSILHGEALTVRTVDPTRIEERESDMMLPAGHAGRTLLMRIIAAAAQSTGG